MMNDRRFVIGDIHGCSLTLNHLLKEKCRITSNDKIYFLGDYIDRGPDSKGVIDILLSLKSNGYHVEFLMGNHEEMFINSSDSPEDMKRWMLNGASSTLKSFGIRKYEDLPYKYRNFFDNLNYYLELDDYILVHAGLNFSIENPFHDLFSMLWSRNKITDTGKTRGKKIITGHTPVPLKIIEQSMKTNKIMLDGGCVYRNIYEGFGYLCALELNSMKLFASANMEVYS